MSNIFTEKYINNNKAKIIDYFILIKLIFLKYNVHFYDTFYQEIIEYILPKININNLMYNTISNTYYCLDYDDILNFNNKYNIKNKYIKLLFKNSNFLNEYNNSKKNNFNMKIDIQYNTSYDYYIRENGVSPLNGIIFIKLTFIKDIFYILNYTITNFIYEIPLYMIYEIQNINTFTQFDNIITNIWENNLGFVMYDYIVSDTIKKIIYYEFFKKIILRLNIF